jgi:fused signal recognition particle receptor
MFKFLKEKISKAVKSIAEKLEKKEEVVTEEKKEEQKMEAAVQEAIEQPVFVEPVIVEQPKPEPIHELPKEEPVAERKEVEVQIEEKVEVKEEVHPEIPVVERIERRFEEEKIKVVEAPKVEEKISEEPKKEEKKGFFQRIVEKVVRPVVKKVTVKKLSESDVMPILSEMTEGMIEADVAYDVAEKIKSDLAKSLVDQEIKRGTENEVIVSALRNSLMEILHIPGIDLAMLAKQKNEQKSGPVVILFLGFNGSGKTTSLAKVGDWLKEKGFSVVFAAADTFRAAAEEQLEEHATKIGVKVIKHRYGADPAAVIFDAIEHAKANRIDFVLADTAGRAHTNKNLMDQMQKIIKVNKPDLKILVIDSLTGNDAVLQARMFNEVGVDGLIFTKVDVNEKGGAILSVTHELKKPILFLGLGQTYKDFKRFDANEFVNLLLS